MSQPHQDPRQPEPSSPVLGLTLMTCWAVMGWLGSVRSHPVAMVSVYLAASLAWALACRGILSAGKQPSTLWILIVAAGCRLVALPGEPSDDMARYRWEGLVQLAGHDPYREAPADPALAELAEGFADHGAINHPSWTAIYPPGMMLWNRAVAWISPTALAFKLSFLAVEALLMAALLAWLKSRGLPAQRLLIFAWCPLAVFSTALEGHHDVLAAAALMGGVLALERGWPSTAALLVCAALLTKGFAVAALPALILPGRRQRGSPSPRESSPAAVIPLRCWWAGLALVALTAAPFVSSGGLTTSLTRFGAELHFNDSVHDLLTRLTGPATSRPLAALIWVVGSAVVLLRSRPDTGRRVALLLAGLLLVLPTVHPWYPLALLPLLCIFPWWGWLAFSATVSLPWLAQLEISATGRWVEWHGLKLPEYAALFAWLAWRLFRVFSPVPTSTPTVASTPPKAP